jgi:hypothetical protein
MEVKDVGSMRRGARADRHRSEFAANANSAAAVSAVVASGRECGGLIVSDSSEL